MTKLPDLTVHSTRLRSSAFKGEKQLKNNSLAKFGNFSSTLSASWSRISFVWLRGKGRLDVIVEGYTPGVTKRCRLSWLTNGALEFEPKCIRWGGGVLANECSCAHGAQIKFGDQTPYLTYGYAYNLPGSDREEGRTIRCCSTHSPSSHIYYSPEEQ